MKIELRDRMETHVREYFERTKQPEIRAMLPQKAATVEEALEAFRVSMGPESSSYGRTIYVDGRYVGDIWCYGIEPGGDPEAMVSYCIFEKSCWGKGLASTALSRFIDEIGKKFGIMTIGAFTYASNVASIKALKKNGFREEEHFFEDGIESVYFQVAGTSSDYLARTLVL